MQCYRDKQHPYCTSSRVLDVIAKRRHSKEKLLNTIRSLVANKAQECNDILISMVKICDSVIVEPHCLIIKKCLAPHQSGFHPGDSTIKQLLSITHEMYTAFEDTPSREIRAVFWDLLKVFDRVWHNGLLYKLECNGICGNILGIIQDFLHERKQPVMLNGKIFKLVSCFGWCASRFSN